ncbi:MAG TPA: hypothetical protein VNZ86_20775, partial [Bacteroidia bacterium]|nr:hypothetical protein [Bacteroidia bacterium]
MKYNLIHLALFLLFLSPSLYAQKNQETPNSADSCKVYVPNALSANMEGLQCFRVQFSCPVKSFKIS